MDAERKPAIAVAIPAFNESEGIAEFIGEIRAALLPFASQLTLVVVDDASTDGTVAALHALADGFGDGSALEVIAAQRNRGHGPTLLRAYRRALELEPDFVLAVDGDGQFQGSDLRRALVLLADEAHAVCGVRRFRQDPWFRMVMTRLLRIYVWLGFGVRARDPNCPLRGFEAPLLSQLLGLIGPDCLIPNLYLTILASRRGAALLEVDVSHHARRGASAEGTSWGGRHRFPIPWRLVRFSLAALLESRAFRARLPRLISAGAAAPGSTASPPPRPVR